MRTPVISFIITVLCAFTAHAQQIPDLSTGDYYLPYLTEQKKQQKISDAYLGAAKKKFPQTSEELYPQLYKGKPVELPPGVAGTSADPANAMKQYGIVQMNTGNRPVAYSGMPDLGQSIDQRNMQTIEADMRGYNECIQQQQQLIDDAMKELYKPEINYHLGLHNGVKVDPFIKAQQTLEAMLNGTEKTDFAKAVYAVESAVDKTLTWNEFNSMLQDGVQTIGALMKQDKLSPTDNLAKVMAIYRFMADTTKVFVASKEKMVVSKPMLYDFEDYEAKKDLTKVFVSKLLRTGTGQCMSLPTLFYLYAKAINANVNLVFAPEHSYITFKDNRGNRQNIELTGRMFTTTDFYWQTGFIKSEQVKSGIYLKPLTEKEVLVHLITTLARAYVRTFGTDERLLEMATISRQYAPNDLSANMLTFCYHRELYKNIIRQYNVFRLPEAEFESDEKRKQAEKNMYASFDHLKKDLGYDKMPDWAYKQWLDGVNAVAKKQEHLSKRRELEQQLNK